MAERVGGIGGVKGAGPNLTDKQAAFVQAYLANGKNASAAYKTAYKSKMRPADIAAEASRLLRNPKVAPYITQAQDGVERVVRAAFERYNITQEGLIHRLCMLADYDQSELIVLKDGSVTLKSSTEISPELAYAITEIYPTPSGTRVKLADKRAALMDIARLRGWVVDKAQQIGADGKPVNPGSLITLLVQK